MRNNHSKISVASYKKIDYDNTAEETIAINVSKARLIYKNFIKEVPRFKDVLEFFGLALTCFIAAATGTFSDAFNIEGSGIIIHITLWLGTIFFFIFFCINGMKYFFKRKEYDEDSFINALKKSE